MQATHQPSVPLLAAGVRDLLLFNLAPDTTAILRISPNSKALVGTAPTDLLGLPLATLIHPDDAAVFTAELHDAARSSGAFRFHARIASALARSGYAPFDLHGSMQAAGFLSLSARPLLFEQSAAAGMDALLDLKMEEMRLLRQIQELRSEELNAEGDEVVFSNSSTVVVQREPSSRPARAVENDADIVFRPRSIDIAPQHRRPAPRVEKRRAEYRRCCQSCSTTTAPRWRRSRSGRSFLCNACGLRYSKTKKRRKLQTDKPSNNGAWWGIFRPPLAAATTPAEVSSSSARTPCSSTGATFGSRVDLMTLSPF